MLSSDPFATSVARGSGAEQSPPRRAVEQHPIPAATSIGPWQLLSPGFYFKKQQKAGLLFQEHNSSSPLRLYLQIQFAF